MNETGFKPGDEVRVTRINNALTGKRMRVDKVFTLPGSDKQTVCHCTLLEPTETSYQPQEIPIEGYGKKILPPGTLVSIDVFSIEKINQKIFLFPLDSKPATA